MLRSVVLLLVVCAGSLIAMDFPMTAQHEGPDEHHYLQRAHGAAAVSLTAKPAGRLVIAFPSANSGVGIWVEDAMQDGEWGLAIEPELEVTANATATSPRQQVSGILRTKRARLKLRAPLGGTLRLLRAYDRQSQMDPRSLGASIADRFAQLSPARRDACAAAGLTGERIAAWLVPQAELTPRKLTLTWSTLTGRPGHVLELTVGLGGSIARSADGRLEIEPGPAGTIGFRADCGHPALTPWPAAEVFDPAVVDRCKAIEAKDARRGQALREGLGRLRFLVYREKLLAGSWRYLTYFGRDTLLTLRMLRGVFRPAVVEAALASVIARLSPEGQVAHEEDLGDMASMDHAEALFAGRTPPAALDEPVYDYKMVDSDFLLPIALAEYAADARVGAARAQAFLAEGDRLARVRRNAERVLAQAVPYGKTRAAKDLVSLLPGLDTGDWRDSLDGLARGRYAYSLNAVLIPQALWAIDELARGGVLGDAAALAAHPELARFVKDAAGRQALRDAWAGAAKHFDVSRSAEEVAKLSGEYLKGGPLAEAERLAFDAFARGPGEGLVFPAVSLDADTKPIPVMCSDGVLALFGPPLPAAALPGLVKPLVTPFPRGLLTPAGLLVASPALSGDADLWARFAGRHYHGTVVWAWPMAMAELGLGRQLAALAAGAAERPELERARDALRGWRRKLQELGLGELWTFQSTPRGIEPARFGASATDTTESNSLQLWSAAWLVLGLED